MGQTCVLDELLWYCVKWAYSEEKTFTCGAVAVLQLRCDKDINLGFPHIAVGKESVCSTGDPASIPGLRRSPGEGNGNSLQYSCPGKKEEPGGLQSRGSQKSRTRMSTYNF